MKMTRETQIRESRDSHRVAPGGRNRKPNIKVLAFLLSAVCCTVGAAEGIYLNRRRTAPVSQQGLTYEANVVSGDIPGKTGGQRQKELDNVVEEDVFTMSMNVASLGKTTGADRSVSWTMENPSNRGELIRMEITRDDTGEKVFETGTIRPGDYLESDPLLTPLPAREYDCTAVFLAYQEETETLIGQAAVKIKLVLQK